MEEGAATMDLHKMYLRGCHNGFAQNVLCRIENDGESIGQVGFCKRSFYGGVLHHPMGGEEKEKKKRERERGVSLYYWLMEWNKWEIKCVCWL